MHDVFISFSFKDQKIAEEIVNKLLNAHQVTYWICTRDIAAGSRYKREIVRAIAEARAFVLIQSSNSIGSEEVPKEVSLALERQKIIIPFAIDHSQLDGDLAYDLAGIHRIDATRPTLDERIAELADQIRKVIRLSSPTEESKAANSVSETRLLRSSQIRPNSSFKGRSFELESIHQALKSSGKAFIQGIGGIGKSEIAKKYALQYQSEYDTMIWAPYQSSLKETVISNAGIDIRDFERVTGETDDAYYHRKLNKLKALSDERTLIMIDNFDTEYDEELENFADGRYSLLITTRNDHTATGIPVVNIGELSEDEQFELFEQNYKRPLLEKDRKYVQEILSLINGHTLTIELIAKLMQTKRTSPEKMLETIRAFGIAPTLSGKVEHGFSSRTIYSYIQQLFNISLLEKEEIALLMNLSLLPLEGIGFEEFADLCELEDCEKLNSLIKKSWIIYDANSDTIRMHPLISEVVTNECNPDLHKCHIMFDKIIGKLDHYQFQKMKYDTICAYGRILQAIYEKFPNPEQEYFQAYDTMMALFIHVGLYAVALELGLKQLETRIGFYSEKSIPVGTICYYLGDLYGYLGDYEKSVYYLEKSMDSFQAVSPNSLDYAYVVKFYILRMIHSGALKPTERIADDVCAKRKMILDLLNECKRAFDTSTEESGILTKGRHAFLGSLDHCYALYYIVTGEFDQAIEYGNKSYQYYIDPEYLEDKPWAVSPLSALSIAYAYKGETEKAVSLALQALSISQEYFHEMHARTFQQWEFLSQTYHILGMHQEETDVLLHMKEIMDHAEMQSLFLYKRILARIESGRGHD